MPVCTSVLLSLMSHSYYSITNEYMQFIYGLLILDYRQRRCHYDLIRIVHEMSRTKPYHDHAAYGQECLELVINTSSQMCHKYADRCKPPDCRRHRLQGHAVEGEEDRITNSDGCGLDNGESGQDSTNFSRRGGKGCQSLQRGPSRSTQ
jgi:hypothetical protein